MDIKNKEYTRNGLDIMFKSNNYITDIQLNKPVKKDNVFYYNGRIVRATNDYITHAANIASDITDGKLEVISPIPPYYDFFEEVDWVLDNGDYKLVYNATEHKQQGVFLTCLLFDENGNNILPAYSVALDGTFTLWSGVPFDGRLAIKGVV